jgi:hypothetical protein
MATGKFFRARSFFFSMIFIASKAEGHGEGKLGPHGGHIRMPGAFHTEFTLDHGARRARVYVLDMNFKPFTTESAEIKVSYVHKAGRVPLSCHRLRSFFECQVPMTIKLDVGSINLEAKISGHQGIEVAYALPLRLMQISH